jgi:hypothetical protein
MISYRALVLAAMAVTVLVTACTGTREVPGRPGPASSSSALPAPGQNDVRRALLTADDLPSGFTEVAVPDEGALGAIEGCPPLDTGNSSDVDAEAAAAFTDGAAIISETILQMPEDGARQAMSDLAKVLSECREFRTTIGGLDIVFTPNMLDLAPMGDETVALRFIAQLAGTAVKLEEHMVAVRHGGTLLLVTHIAAGSVDRAVTESISRTAYEKVARQ